MKFKINDLVRIVNAPSPLPGDAPFIGKVGTIRGIADESVAARYQRGPYWAVDLANEVSRGDLWVSEACLRLIPGDTEGRKVVDWNWREMVTPSLVSA